MMPRIPWKVDPATLKQFAPGVWDPETDPVELYYLPDDFTQARTSPPSTRRRSPSCRSSSGRRPSSYDVRPLLGGMARVLRNRAAARRADRSFTYYGAVQNVASGTIPPIYNHSYAISADLEIRGRAPKA